MRFWIGAIEKKKTWIESYDGGIEDENQLMLKVSPPELLQDAPSLLGCLLHRAYTSVATKSGS